MRVGFIVDHPKRDLHGGVMLAHALARRGAQTALIPLYEQAVDVPLLGLDALVVNYARPVNQELVRGYIRAGLPVWVLDTEGGVLADDGANTPDRLAAYIKESGFGALLAGYFFWGSTLHEAFVRHSGMAPQSLHVTGCPRFDCAAPRWRSMLDFPRDGFVLVNANFPLANPLFASSPEAEIGTLTAAGWKADYVVQMLRDSRLILRNYIDTVRRVALHFPEKTFLLRPHPFENAGLYRTELAAVPNISVDGAGSVLNVIQHAQCVLHLNCGTSIEAILLGKLPLSMEFLNTELMSNHSSLPSQVSQRVDSEVQLERILSQIDDATRAFPFVERHDQLIKPWFHANDGAAADRVADVLMQAVRSRAARLGRVSLGRSLASSRARSSPQQRLQALAANLVGSKATAALRARWQPQRRDKALDLQVIQKLGAAVQRLDAGAGWSARQATHPVSGAKLASILISQSVSTSP
jgi:surface carbohydrate biosynthesis protein